MNYNLTTKKDNENLGLDKLSTNWLEFWEFLKPEKFKLGFALILVGLGAIANILNPYLISKVIDGPIKNNNISELFGYVLILLTVYLVSTLSSFFQTRIMGAVAQNTLFALRTKLFGKIQELPLAFFNQNQSGDLTSRINNDADKLNQLLSESILRFLGNFTSVFGIAIFILFLNFQLALVTLFFLIPIIIITQIISPFVESYNKAYSAKLGELTSEVQGDLDNFRVIVAFDRRQYFEEKLTAKIKEVEKMGQRAEFLNSVIRPIYDVISSIALVSVLGFGAWQLQNNQIQIGLLVGFVAYANSLYSPLRILASIWGNIQSSLGAWSRVREILNLESNLVILEK